MSKSTSRFTFKLVSKSGDWFALRAPTWSTSCRNARDAQSFEAQVAEWLLSEIDDDPANGAPGWHLGNGDAHGYPSLPMAFTTGSGLCLLLKRKADVIRFANAFPVADLANLDQLLEDTSMRDAA